MSPEQLDRARQRLLPPELDLGRALLLVRYDANPQGCA